MLMRLGLKILLERIPTEPSARSFSEAARRNVLAFRVELDFAAERCGESGEVLNRRGAGERELVLWELVELHGGDAWGTKRKGRV